MVRIHSYLIRNYVSFSFIYLGSPYGAGTFAGPTGARQPSALELDIAKTQGSVFYKTVSKAFP